MTVDTIGRNLTGVRRLVYALAFGLAVVAVGNLLLAVHILDRQHLSDRRNEQYRSAICGILATIPGKVPPAIEHGRKVFARHPGQCAPLPGATPKPSTIRVIINGKPGKIVVNPPPPSNGGGTPAATPASRPSPQPRPTHSPSPSPSPTQRPTPSPSPSPTCDLTHPLRCL